MKKLDLKQGSDEWLSVRRQSITATDASSIMGLNPYTSAYELWKMKKTATEKFSTEAMIMGKNLEPIAVSIVEEKTGKIFVPCVVQDAEYDFLMASLDGLDFDEKIVLEVKCSQRIYERASNGIIDQIYECQMQHQLMVTGLEKALFCAYSPHSGDTIIISVSRSEDFINEMRSKEIEFYNRYILSDEEPPLGEKDHYPLKVNQFQEEAIREYICLEDSLKQLTEKQKTIKKYLQDLGDDGNIEFVSNDGDILLRMTRVNREGNVEWKDLCNHYGISELDINMFRKPAIGYYKFTHTR